MIKSPFKFLDSYTREDRAIFFGRDQEITELYRRLFESKVLLVYGVSGTGKSSLINCGLASRFDDSDWLPVNIRRGRNINESLDEAFSKQALTSFNKNFTFSEKLQSIYLDHFKPVYLIFDQFEELFIFGSENEKKDFIGLINEAIEAETQCRVIFIIREEFLAGMTEFEYELPSIFSNRLRVEKMKRTNALLAIEGPCKVHNIETESGFAEALLNKLCPSGNDIELTFLQIYLDRIFRIVSAENNEQSDLKFSNDVLERAGSVSDLLGQFLEEQIREMEDPNTGMSILKSFVSVHGTKKRMEEKEIMASAGTFGINIDEQSLLKYIARFVDLRILRERDESGHFELIHDALAAKIYEKFTLVEKELLEVRLFVENAFQAYNTRKLFLSRDDLDYLSTYEKRLFLPDELNTFIRGSKDQLQSQQRALRRLTSIVAVVFLIIVAAGVRFYMNKKGFAETKELTTLALLQEKVDPLTSINTAFKIREKDSVSTVVQGIILNSFYKLLEERLASGDTSISVELLPRSIPVTGSILSMHLNNTGTHLFGWTDNKEVFTRELNSPVVRSFVAGNEVVIVEMSPDAKYLAVIYKDGKGDVFNINGKRQFAFETTVNHLMNNRLVRFFPSGKYFLAAVKDNKAVIYDSTGANLFDLSGHTGRVNSLDISPDGRFIATASCDKSVLIWNFNYKTRQFSPYDTLKRYKDKIYTYGHQDSIIGPNDTIWSCEFSRSGKYILTASADSMLNIWSLNGFLRNIVFVFNINSPRGGQWYWPLFGRISEMATGIKKSDLENNYLSGYYQRISDATFAAEEHAVIASNYSYTKISENDKGGLFRIPVLYLDGYSWSTEDHSAYRNLYVSKAQELALSQKPANTDILEASSDRKLFATVSEQMCNIKLVAQDGYVLAGIPGSFPVFSNDGKYLLYLSGKSIRCVPVKLQEIYRMIYTEKLFGEQDIGHNIWKTL
jgi:WD40 repeat protein